jgi:hypothetical protein
VVEKSGEGQGGESQLSLLAHLETGPE